MKIVLDTNALINAETDENNFANRILDAVLEGKVEAFANSATIRENMLIVQRKVTDPEFKRKLENYFDAIQPVETQRLHVVEDEEDNKILASAAAAAVDYLITSDWHLLKLENYQGVKIVTPQGFWAEYETGSGSAWQDWMNKFFQ